MALQLMNGDRDDSDGGNGDDAHDDDDDFHDDDDDDDVDNGDGQPDGPHIPCNFTHRGTTLAGIGQLIHIVSRSYICLSLNSFFDQIQEASIKFVCEIRYYYKGDWIFAQLLKTISEIPFPPNQFKSAVKKI